MNPLILEILKKESALELISNKEGNASVANRKDKKPNKVNQ